MKPCEYPVFVVRISQANMPSSMVYGRSNYKDLAIMRMAPGFPFPRMISERARGCLKIEAFRGKVHIGDTPKSEGFRELKRLQKLAAEKTGRCEGTISRASCHT